MESPERILENGTVVRTHQSLGPGGFSRVKYQYLKARKPNATGKIAGVVGTYGGDVYWVTHSEKVVACYCFDEFELAPNEVVPEASTGAAKDMWSALDSDDL